MMLGKDGIDACWEITAALPDEKVLTLTAFADSGAANRAITAGAANYLPKLCGRDKLLNALGDAAQGLSGR